MRIASFLLFLFLRLASTAQSVIDPPYHINGNAFKENCNCYTLTPDLNTQAGSVWNMNKISLLQSFDYQFEIYLGCTDEFGADGIAFILQPISTVVGSSGNGLGFEGIRPSVGVLVDTWQNTEDADPPFDHLSIASNGQIDHFTTCDLTGPVSALPNNGNIEDCQWHNLRIQWDADNHLLTATIDGQQSVHAEIDMVADVFSGNAEVFWGFSASTGGQRNLQRFCTSLNAGFSVQPQGNFCAPSVVEFADQSRSFGSILEWHWNFGDGTTFSGQSPPAHAYAAPGNYDVQSVILGNNGCWSDTFHQVLTIGSVPVAFIDGLPTLCDNQDFPFQNGSSVEYGTISQWNWIINGQPFSTASPDPGTLSPGPLDIQLQVQTEQGCVSSATSKTITVLPAPAITFEAPDSACLREPVELTATSIRSESPVIQWLWQPAAVSAGTITYVPEQDGVQTLSVTGRGANGCYSDTLWRVVEVISTQADAGRDTVLALGESVVLQGSGGPLLQWSPAYRLSETHAANPVASPERETWYALSASTSIGCVTVDSVLIRVFRGPELYVPSAFSPNGDQRNDRFRFVAAGFRQLHYFRIYNRWGQLLYNSVSPEGWDGTIGGREQAAGMYVWSISGEDIQGRQVQKKGSFMLIR